MQLFEDVHGCDHACMSFFCKLRHFRSVLFQKLQPVNRFFGRVLVERACLIYEGRWSRVVTKLPRVVGQLLRVVDELSRVTDKLPILLVNFIKAKTGIFSLF